MVSGATNDQGTTIQWVDTKVETELCTGWIRPHVSAIPIESEYVGTAVVTP